MDLYDDAENDIQKKASVICKINNNHGDFQKTLSLYDNQNPVVERYHYPEERIIQQAFFDDKEKSLSVNKKTGFNFIENIVALNKGLLQMICDNNKSQGKWYFTRLKLRGLTFDIIDVFTSVKIIFKKNMQFKLTDSIIVVDNLNIRNIYFSLV
jgi:hypothetical protein